jgi:hypothetical protein
MGFPPKLKACGKRTFIIGLHGLSSVPQIQLDFASQLLTSFPSHMARVLLAAGGLLSILSLERVYSHSIVIMH